MLANIIRNTKKTAIGGGGGGIVTGGDPYYSAVSLLLPMDGSSGSTNFVDSGPNALAVTAVGNAQISTTQSKYGGASGAFDGTGDYLSLSSNSIFAFGTGDFTVEFWMYITSRKAYGYILYTQGGSDALFVSFDAAGNYLRLTNSGTVYAVSPTLNLNQWYHIAVVRSSGSSKVYVDGVGGTAVACGASFVQTGPLIGGTASANYFQGYIDDLRVTKYARYQSSFTPPAQAHPNIYNPYTTLPVSGAALWLDASQQNTIFSDAGTTPVTTSGQSIYQWNDLSGNNRHAVQATSGNRPTWVPPASGQNGLGAVSFNGSSQWLDIASFPSLSTGYTFYAVIKQASADGLVFCTANAGTLNSIAAIWSGPTTNTMDLTQWGSGIKQTVTTGAVVGFIGTYDGSHPTGNFLVRTSPNSFNTSGTLPQNAGTPAAGAARVGRATNTQPYYFNSQLYELVVLPRQSTTAEDTSWKSYSASKWGITWS